MVREKTLVVIGLILFFIYGISLITKYEIDTSPTITNSTTTKVDSLYSVIDSLETEIFILENGFDSKEKRYEDILFEYELGISYLKDYHPKAYKDFHRIIGMRERYSIELEKENNKRLKTDKF